MYKMPRPTRDHVYFARVTTTATEWIQPAPVDDMVLYHVHLAVLHSADKDVRRDHIHFIATSRLPRDKFNAYLREVTKLDARMDIMTKEYNGDDEALIYLLDHSDAKILHCDSLYKGRLEELRPRIEEAVAKSARIREAQVQRAHGMKDKDLEVKLEPPTLQERLWKSYYALKHSGEFEKPIYRTYDMDVPENDPGVSAIQFATLVIAHYCSNNHALDPGHGSWNAAVSYIKWMHLFHLQSQLKQVDAFRLHGRSALTSHFS